jgi:hypothetical protein
MIADRQDRNTDHVTMIKSQSELDEIQRMLEADIGSLFKLVFTFRKPGSESDARLASVILRKWLLDGLLSQLCGAAQIVPTFYIVDNSVILDEIKKQPSIDYFLTGGIKFNGKSIFGPHHSTLPFQGKSLLPIDKMPDKEVNLKEFLSQKRLFFRGHYFTCENIIRYAANKLGGAHLDFDRPGYFSKLEEAAAFMKFGGPHPAQIAISDCTIYQVLEPQGSEVLTAIHIEIIAAATSFIQLRLNGQPLVRLQTKKSLRTRIRTLIGKDKTRFIFHDLGAA